MCRWQRTQHVRIHRIGTYRKMTSEEQENQAVMYRTTSPVVVTCLYQQRREKVTVPAGYVFNGDNFQELWKKGSSTGIAWLVHDWLYGTRAFDQKPTGISTPILDHRTADELMYRILELEQSYVYSAFLQTVDTLAECLLAAQWNKAEPALQYRPNRSCARPEASIRSTNGFSALSGVDLGHRLDKCSGTLCMFG